MNQNNGKNKIVLSFFVFCLLFLLVLGKAFKIQIVDRKELIARSKSQIFREAKVYPKRGNIYDRNNNPLAINIQTYSIFTIPKELNGNYGPYKKLAKIVERLNYRKIRNKIKGRKQYTWIARKIKLSKDQVKSIKKLKGIYIDSVPKRLYPNHEIASQIIGFVGVDNVGLSGLEYLFNEDLKGSPKVFKYVKDAKGRAVKFESEDLGKEARDLTLTIDKDLQAYAEKTLKESVLKHKAAGGGIGIMDVHTGEILAMSNYPTYDPNRLSESLPAHRKLSFATDPFEPGSTFKTFTIVSAFENKISTPETNYYCERGRFKVEDHVISEAEGGKKFEWLSVEEILQYSSNIGTTKIAFDLTYPKLQDTLLKFEIGNKTGIEIPGESRGIFTDKENVSPLSLSNISFGQGVATTGIQMLAAYAAIANGGEYIRPTLIMNSERGAARRIMSKKTAREVESILIEAVENGTGGKARIPMFKIAGKTSTAQKVSPEGGYEGYISGFIGYPTNVKKRFAVYVYIDNPQGVYYGNLVAGPVFNKVSQYLLLKNKDFSQLAVGDLLTESGIDTVRVKHSATRVSNKSEIPNFIGLDKVSANNLAEKMNIKISHRGIGVVTSQKPKVGSAINQDSIIFLKYSPPIYE
jgi:cell division protein FtsI (penicillin-binding protein 3)